MARMVLLHSSKISYRLVLAEPFTMTRLLAIKANRLSLESGIFVELVIITTFVRLLRF